MAKRHADLEFQHMDDPYKTIIKWQPDGSVLMSVEAMVLTGKEAPGTNEEVLAECERRLERMVDFIHHIHRR